MTRFTFHLFGAALSTFALATTVADGGQFPLERIDTTDAQVTIAADVYASDPNAGPFGEADGGQFFEYDTGATFATESDADSADISTGFSLASLVSEAGSTTDWGNTSLAPECYLAASVVAKSLPDSGTFEGYADWNCSAQSGGYYEVLSDSGNPSVTEGTLSGFIDFLFTRNELGNSTLEVFSTFDVRVGDSWLHGEYDPGDEEWHVTGELSDSSGDLEEVDEYWGAAINLIIPVAQPAEVGDIILMSTHIAIDGVAIASGDHMWGFSITAGFEVEY